MGKMESQRSVFDSLGSNPKAPKRKAIHDRLEVVQDVKNNASHLVKRNLLKGFEKGENEESVGSGDDVVPPQDGEASSFHITLCDETPIEGEDAEDAPHELEEGVRAAIDELKEEMPGLDPKVVVHRLAVKKACRPVKQAQWRFRPELIPSIKGEVNKLIEAGFIREVKYPTWISNIVGVRNKNSQIRVCVDFRDLNVACPKDDFPLPIT
nr:uncharacterized protein LOC109154689 [Ipomoea batatas]